MPFALPKLPYPGNALEPHISGNTMSFHHGKHHKAYVDNLNKLIAGTSFEGKSLDEIVLAAARDTGATAVFNNAAQHWNHTLFWNSMAPQGGGTPKGELARRIENDFGGFGPFKDRFVEAATGQFGSGWVWLVATEDDTLKIVATANALCPMIDNQRALLTCDVWEHAYYLDYQNRRAEFVAKFLDKLANWTFAAQRLDAEPAETEALRAYG